MTLENKTQPHSRLWSLRLFVLAVIILCMTPLSIWLASIFLSRPTLREHDMAMAINLAIIHATCAGLASFLSIVFGFMYYFHQKKIAWWAVVQSLLLIVVLYFLIQL